MEVVNRYRQAWVQMFGPISRISRKFPLMDPIIVPIVCGLYLLFVFYVPKAMGNKRYNLKPVMRFYNVFMVLLSMYMGTTSLWQAYRAGYSSVFCVPFAKGELRNEMGALTWLFTVSKTIEFLDTVFMILEKRMSQLSFLHVYHHVSIFAYWFAITWAGPGSDAYFSLAINSYIHVIMYGYYFVSSFGYKKFKYYITYMQLLQFVSFCFQSVIVGWLRDCEFPQILARALLWYMLTLIALFGNFLIQNKFKKSRRPPVTIQKKAA